MVGPGKPCAGCGPRIGPNADPPAFGKKHGCYPCPGCEGTGWRRRRTTDVAIDAYAGVEVESRYAADDISVGAMRRALQVEKERPELRDTNLRRAQRLIDQQERPESLRFSWEDAWDRMCAAGSYAELMVALEVLRGREESRYSVVWQIVCLQQPVTLSSQRQAFLNESMAVLASFMPERIRVPYWLREDKKNALKKESLWRGRSPAHARERKERDAEVCRLAFEEDWKNARLCAWFALSLAQVKRIKANGRSQ